jgi:copper(I)-binding protein
MKTGHAADRAQSTRVSLIANDILGQDLMTHSPDKTNQFMAMIYVDEIRINAGRACTTDSTRWLFGIQLGVR